MNAMGIKTYSVTRAGEFTAERAWGAADIAEMGGVTVRLHWTDAPYKWHVNDGAEVFAVLDGRIDMHVRGTNGVEVVALEVGDVFYAGVGCEHVAHPQGAARILVVEKKGSV
jgi:mannose-6-phosphate isomerase-like protein (cupin superfamily)